jgi:protein TonB
MNWPAKPIATIMTGLICALYFNVIWCEEIRNTSIKNNQTLQVVDMKLIFASPLANKNTKNNKQSLPPEVLNKPPEPINKKLVPEVLKPVAPMIKQVNHLASESVHKSVLEKKVEIEMGNNNTNTTLNETDDDKNNEATTIENSSELSYSPSLVKSTHSVGSQTSTGVESAMALYMAQVRDYIAKQKRYPKEAKIRRHQGSVSISFIIDADGRVSESKIVKPCKSRYINKSVKVLLSKLRFNVAPKIIKNQFPKTILLEVNYQFS